MGWAAINNQTRTAAVVPSAFLGGPRLRDSRHHIPE